MGRSQSSKLRLDSFSPKNRHFISNTKKKLLRSKSQPSSKVPEMNFFGRERDSGTSGDPRRNIFANIRRTANARVGSLADSSQLSSPYRVRTHYFNKYKTPQKWGSVFGGERGIRPKCQKALLFAFRQGSP